MGIGGPGKVVVVSNCELHLSLIFLNCMLAWYTEVYNSIGKYADQGKQVVIT